eukprot:364655-Chlamydomonas_euryale.AAC.4
MQLTLPTPRAAGFLNQGHQPTVAWHVRSPCGVVWCGVVWCGVVWCGVVWCGVVWCGVVWCGVVWCGVVAMWRCRSRRRRIWRSSSAALAR